MQKNTDLLKFNIQYRIDAMPHAEAKATRKALLNDLGLSRPTVTRILTAEHGDDYDPGSNVLIKISGLFGCTAEELYTEPVQKLSPVEVQNAEKLGLIK